MSSETLDLIKWSPNSVDHFSGQRKISFLLSVCLSYLTSMKILAVVTLLLLVVAVREEDPGDSPVPSHPDNCNYTAMNAMCGDQCINSNRNWFKSNSTYKYCYCGSDTHSAINPRYGYENEHCCGESCTLDSYGHGVCSEGRTQSKSSPCNTTMGVRCYNSYQHSLNIGH